MRRRILILVLLFLLFGVCEAGDRPVIEGVYACGYMSRGNTAIGILASENGLKVIRPGQQLGDYTVHSLSADGAFVLIVEGEQHLIEWVDGETSPSAGSGPVQVRLEEVNCLDASQALAKLLGYSFFGDQNFLGLVSIRGAFQEDELWVKLLNVAEEQRFVKKMVGSAVVIGAPEKVARVEAALKQDFRADKLVTFDFTNAELYYVLKVLTENELEMEGRFPPNIDGGVTITSYNSPASALLEASLALQDTRYKVVWSAERVLVTQE